MAKEEFGPAGPKSEGVGTDGHAVAQRIVKAGAEVGSCAARFAALARRTRSAGLSASTA